MCPVLLVLQSLAQVRPKKLPRLKFDTNWSESCPLLRAFLGPTKPAWTCSMYRHTD